MPRRNRHDPRLGETFAGWDARLTQALSKLSAKREPPPAAAHTEDFEPIDLDALCSPQTSPARPASHRRKARP